MAAFSGPFRLHLNTFTEQGCVHEEVYPLYIKPADDILVEKNILEEVIKRANKRQVCMSCRQPGSELQKRGLRLGNELWSWTILTCDRAPCKVLCNQDLIGAEYQAVVAQYPAVQLL